MPKRRKRGRPATGHDPILGVRVPVKIIRKIDQVAEALSEDRSTLVRRYLQKGVDIDSRFLLQSSKGRGVVHEYVAIQAAFERAKAAKAAVAHARPVAKLNAEIKAQHLVREATEMAKRAQLKAKILPDRQNRRLSDAEFDEAIAAAKAAIDQAMAGTRRL